MDDQKIRLIFETLGADDIARLRVMLGEVRAEGPQAAAALGQTQVAAAALGERAETAANKVDQVDTASKKASGGVSGFGQSALQAGRGIQDFAQGGIGGVLNNIEGLTMALGLGSGMAGVLTILGVAALVAGPQIREFFASFGATKEAEDSVEGLKKRIKELEDKPSRVAIETRELDIAKDKLENLKKSLAAFDAEQNKQTEAEAASGKAIERAITESGPGAEEVSRKMIADTTRRLTAQSEAGGAIARANALQREGEEGLIAARARAEQATSPEELLGAVGAGKMAQAQIDEGKEAVRDAQLAIIKRAKEIYGDQLLAMEKGHREGQAVATEDFAAQLRGVGEGELATQIEASTPKALAAREEYETRVEEEASATDIEFEAGIKNIKAWSAAQKAEAGRAAAEEKKAQAEAARGEKERERREDKLGAKSDKETAEEFDTSIKVSGIADQAGAMLARIRDQGGVIDPRTGQLRRMGADQQQAYVRRQVEQYLHRPIGTDRFGRTQFANVGMGGEETGLTAQAIVDRGQKEVTRRLGGLAGQQMGNTSRLLAVADSLQNDVIRLQAQMTQQTQGVDGLVRKTRMSKKSPLGR